MQRPHHAPPAGGTQPVELPIVPVPGVHLRQRHLRAVGALGGRAAQLEQRELVLAAESEFAHHRHDVVRVGHFLVH